MNEKLKQTTIHIKDFRSIIIRTRLLFERIHQSLIKRLGTAVEGRNRFIIEFSNDFVHIRSGDGEFQDFLCFKIGRNRQGVSILSLGRANLQLLICTVSSEDMELTKVTLLAFHQQSLHAVNVGVVGDDKDNSNTVLGLFFSRQALDDSHSILQVGRNTSETTTSSDNQNILRVLVVHDLFLLGNGSMGLAEEHGVRSFDVGLDVLLSTESSKLGGPAVLASGNTNVEVEMVTFVVGDGHGMVFEEADRRNVDVGNSSNEITVLPGRVEDRADSDINIDSTVEVLDGGGAGVSVDGVPTSQLIEEIENDGNVSVVDKVEAVENDKIKENNEDDGVKVIEDFPGLTTDDRDSGKEGEEDDGNQLEEDIGGDHVAHVPMNVLPGVLGIRRKCD